MLEEFGRKLLSNTETKPAVYTTEFWLHLLAQVLLWVEAIPLEGTPQWLQIVVSAALALGYMITRGLAKGGVAPK